MNWGNRLFLTFIVFGTGMAFLVYRSVKTNYELVEKDYYKNELSYQQVIDGTNRTNALASSVTIQQTETGILLQLPDEMSGKKITGTILFYCAYDQTKDRKMELQTDEKGIQIFSIDSFAPGTYTVKINWVSNSISYHSENNLIIH
jgi:FixH